MIRGVFSRYMHKGYLFTLTLLICLCSFVQPSFAAPSSILNEKLVPREGVLWGSSEDGQDQAIQDQMGRPFDIYHVFHDWKKGFPTEKDQTYAKKGSILYITWAPRIYRTGENISWKSIAQGEQDETIDQAAKNMKQFQQKIFLSFHHEMDAKKGNGQNPEDYVKAYQRVVDRFKKAGADNVVWVWTVTGSKSNWDKLDSLYPGDEVVDWVAWDPYNWADCRDKKEDWMSFEEVVNEAYGYMNEKYKDKPLMLAEYGTPEKQGDPKGKGDWFRAMPEELKKFPQLKAVVYFNHTDPRVKCSWRIDTSEESIKGFVEASKDPYVNVLHK